MSPEVSLLQLLSLNRLIIGSRVPDSESGLLCFHSHWICLKNLTVADLNRSSGCGSRVTLTQSQCFSSKAAHLVPQENNPIVWPLKLYNNYKKMRVKSVPGKLIVMLCLASFLGGSLLTSRTSFHSLENKNGHIELTTVRHDCDNKRKLIEESSRDIMGEVAKTHLAVKSLDKTISMLQTELASARKRKLSSNSNNNNLVNLSQVNANHSTIPKAFVVIGINTAFSSKKRRDSLRRTWMPKGDKLKKLETEKGIVIRFVIGHSAAPGGVLDRSIDAEDTEYNDFLHLSHVEGYHELSTKTRLYFSTVQTLWDAEFYVKVDDDVHLNLGGLVKTLARYRSKSRIYIGCMKSGPVLSQKGLKYHEPEFWKFGEEGNEYFRHATGQIYAISGDLASYISINTPILHRYANEDVSLGAWLLGLEVQHIDERSMCCGTPPDCELRVKGGNACVASFDWSCSGICKSVERMKMIHGACGEGDAAIWNVDL